MNRFKNVEDSLKSFKEAATKHALATEQGDYKIANKCYAIIVAAVNFLQEQDELQKLSFLLDDNSIGVCMWAATFLLPIDEKRAMQKLDEIANGDGILSFNAQMTLSEWGKGNLKL